jgi:hypothetical protein
LGRALCGLALLLSSAPALAAPPRAVSAVAKPGGGQSALAVGFDEAGALRAAVCPALPCAITSGTPLTLPPEARALAGKSELAVVGIGRGRRAIVVRVPDPGRARNWEAVVVAPLAGAAPKIVFQGWTGLVEGEDGLRRGSMVLVSDAGEAGARRIVVGEQYEELSLCGRPAVMAPQVLSPDDLALHPAKVQRLGTAEREKARRVVAARVEAAAPAAPTLLRAVSASSAVGAPGALTDGNVETTWSENRGGDGRGEFVLMNGAAQLPLKAIELVVRPPTAAVDQGAAPRELWLVTPTSVVNVSLPEDAWRTPGARFRVPLEPPLQADCVALVLESAWGTGVKQRVTLAEVGAHTEFDESSVPGLVGALAGGGQRAEAAGVVLAAMGPPGWKAVASAFERLDEGGRRVALDVLDHAPCDTSLDPYLQALLGPYPAHRVRARDRLRRCGKEQPELAVRALERAPRRAQPLLAAELALVAPERAVRAIVNLAGRGDRERRRLLRVALGRAATNDRAQAAVRGALADPKLQEHQLLELLRALGDGAAALQPEAGRAFARVAPSASFRSRYLLLGPAAVLSSRDEGARSFLRQALGADPSPHIRAQAARSLSDVNVFRPELLRAVEDANVRVREAAVQKLGERAAGYAGEPLARRLDDDPWPLVRAASAEALGKLAPNPAFDEALADALGDDSPHVRAPAAKALGSRRAVRYAPKLRDVLEDDEQTAEVRSAAASALGELCDREALALLTDHARKLADPMLSEDGRMISPAALRALTRIHPPDLANRLQPLLAPTAPPLSQSAARAALGAPGACGQRAGRAAAR